MNPNEHTHILLILRVHRANEEAMFENMAALTAPFSKNGESCICGENDDRLADSRDQIAEKNEKIASHGTNSSRT